MKKVVLAIFGTLINICAAYTQSSEISYGNGLPATDALGRKLSSFEDVGGPRPNKQVGLFYWTWHTDDNATFSPVLNITQILKQYPEAVSDANHPAWRGIEGGIFWWDEPLFGYYRTTDDWVLRKHAEMLTDAGVDVVFFDCTNGSYTWKSSYTKLLQVWTQARADGVKTPQISFFLPFGATSGAMTSLIELYNELYQPGLYKDLWFQWGGKPLILAYSSSLKVNRNSAGLRFTATESFYGINATCPSWGNNIGNLTFRLYKWKNNYSETVAENPIAEKTFVNFKDNAKLQLSFDKQDAGTYLWELCDGTELVGVWKYNETNGNSVSYFNSVEVTGSYESEIAYSPDLNFIPLTIGNDNTPVRILQLTDQQKVDAIKAFFTFRPGQADYVKGPSTNSQWGWLETYPQHGYVPKAAGGYEQVAVGVAQNASDASGGHACAFNSELTYGRSFTKANGQDSRADAYLYGLNFQEQWTRAFQLDPDFIFVTGWNEWTAGRWFDWDVKPFAFVDQYSAEKSRDIEPVKSWGNKADVYYMQLVDNIRKYKGMPNETKASAAKTIDMNNLSDWDEVEPEFLSYKGNTLHRNHRGQGTELVYTNSSGRNDIIKSRVARDTEYIYFYVETAAALTWHSDSKWMRLFIDIDRNKETGWEGYDFLINRNSPTDLAVIERSEKIWDWRPVGTVEYKVDNNTLVLKLKRSLLGINNDVKVDFEFKWSDNMQEDGNLMDFYVNGDVAPSGRFNYHYLADVVDEIPTKTESVFQIYPNPAGNTLNVVFPSGVNGHSTLSVYNYAGQQLWVKNLTNETISDCIDLRFIGSRGLYIIELRSPDNCVREKFIVH
ncbi:T9SS type A sorting domain-containing protein [Gaoshiqia sp. Z1-71]|uniref:T9SS type A sorting domain-containing protein n=1 Tax=Gaoshiqia hydrogeniformans TaxID=3290090 RepID=UPI003BF82DEB